MQRIYLSSIKEAKGFKHCIAYLHVENDEPRLINTFQLQSKKEIENLGLKVNSLNSGLPHQTIPVGYWSKENDIKRALQNILPLMDLHGDFEVYELTGYLPGNPVKISIP